MRFKVTFSMYNFNIKCFLRKSPVCWDLHDQGFIVVGLADSPCLSPVFDGKLVK